MYQINFIGKIKTHFTFKNVFRKSCRFLDNVEKYCTAGQATDCNLAYTHCMLDNYGYKHTLGICNTYCFSTTKMVARKRLNVTSYVLCLSCSPLAFTVQWRSMSGDKTAI